MQDVVLEDVGRVDGGQSVAGDARREQGASRRGEIGSGEIGPGVAMGGGWGRDHRRVAEFCRPLLCHRGITLFELLVGLCIVALLATLAVPGFAGLKRSAGMSSAANELLWALQWARSSAGIKGSPITVCLTKDDRTCLSTPDVAAVGWLVFEAGAVMAASGAAALPPAAILQAFHLPPDVTITGTRPAVTFWPVARAGTTSTFELCDITSRTSGRSIVVSQTGRPRVSPEPASCAG